ncbi:hypothetical protein [Parasitella parasitica]|uniref:Uncharacterized protein n=1 Tax=Parasitella parasitica TaxID=35722 RepID=A0A0B7MPW5_9FUNG|nr:hypothetical protein [Parasitella parasitica]
MLVILTPLIAAIALRSKFNFFMPLDDKKYNVYNATSFFLCISTITWATLWFFKSEKPLTDPEIALSGTRGTRQRSDRHNSTRATETPPSVHRYDAEIDYTLPSYSEVPPPPAYNKVMYSNREAHVEQVEDIPATATDPSFQNRNSTTITNEAISEINSGCNVETNRATTTQSNEPVRQ